MADFDISKLSFDELKKLQRDVAKMIDGYEERKKSDARKIIESRARELGFNLEELTGMIVKKKRAAPTAKYRNPDKADETWSGRGRKPVWYAAQLENGKSPSDMLI